MPRGRECHRSRQAPPRCRQCRCLWQQPSSSSKEAIVSGRVTAACIMPWDRTATVHAKLLAGAGSVGACTHVAAAAAKPCYWACVSIMSWDSECHRLRRAPRQCRQCRCLWQQPSSSSKEAIVSGRVTAACIVPLDKECRRSRQAPHQCRQCRCLYTCNSSSSKPFLLDPKNSKA
jgi:hypothetical protein